MDDIFIIVTIIGTLVAIVSSILTISWRFDGKIDKLDDMFDGKIDKLDDKFVGKIDKINDEFKDTEIKIMAYTSKTDSLDKFVGSVEFRKWFAYLYEKETGTREDTGNPISPEEKQRLIEKFENNTIEREEAERLKQVLEEEKEEAEATGNTKATISIGLLVVALARHIEDFLPENILKLQDEDPDVRRRAAVALGRIALEKIGAEAVEPLIGELKDGHASVRANVARTLGRIGSRLILDSLKEIEAKQKSN
jgi:HEAT repeat protein